MTYKTQEIKVQRADLTCDVIKKLAPFVLSKLWILVDDFSMCWSLDTFLIKLRLYVFSWFVTKETMMKNSKLKFSEYITVSAHCDMQNISSSNSFGRFVLTVKIRMKRSRYCWSFPKEFCLLSIRLTYSKCTLGKAKFLATANDTISEFVTT